MTGAEGRLINWDEGNYMVTDKPNPRGEIILGGDSIAKVTFNSINQIGLLQCYVCWNTDSEIE